jgi:ParB-like chromosome segregation protein Spo0J
MSHELHPLCTLFPRLGDAEFGALVADIRANGLRQPIVTHQGMILDGGNRYRACAEAGVEPDFVEFSGGNIVSFVLSANLHRRHLSPGQQAAIVASAQDWASAQSRGGNRKADQSATLHFDRTADRAAESGASLRTQKMADKVARANPELAKRVAHGEVSLPKAVREVEGKAPTVATPRQQPTSGPATTTAPDADADEGPTVDQLLDEMQVDLRRAEARVADLERALADGGKEHVVNLTKRLEHAERQRDDAMATSARLQREVDRLLRNLMACGKAVGERDQDKIVRAVQAFARSRQEAA